jgi:hypothetical protein
MWILVFQNLVQILKIWKTIVLSHKKSCNDVLWMKSVSTLIRIPS